MKEAAAKKITVFKGDEEECKKVLNKIEILLATKGFGFHHDEIHGA